MTEPTFRKTLIRPNKILYNVYVNHLADVSTFRGGHKYDRLSGDPAAKEPGIQ